MSRCQCCEVCEIVEAVTKEYENLLALEIWQHGTYLIRTMLQHVRASSNDWYVTWWVRLTWSIGSLFSWFGLSNNHLFHSRKKRVTWLETCSAVMMFVLLLIGIFTNRTKASSPIVFNLLKTNVRCLWTARVIIGRKKTWLDQTA